MPALAAGTDNDDAMGPLQESVWDQSENTQQGYRIVNPICQQAQTSVSSVP